MIADLEGILEVNEMDVQIFKLKKKKQILPEEIEKIEKALTEDKQTLGGVEEQIKDLTQENSDLESGIEEFKEKQKKSEERLMTITTNAEYDAVHTEIETHKRKTSEAEDRILQILTEKETLEKQKEEMGQKLESDAFKEKEQALNKLREEFSSLESEIADKESQRKETTKKISTKALRIYDKLHQMRKNGKYVGIATDKKRVCSACACILTPQRFIEVKRNNAIRTCESCGAILIWKKE